MEKRELRLAIFEAETDGKISFDMRNDLLDKLDDDIEELSSGRPSPLSDSSMEEKNTRYGEYRKRYIEDESDIENKDVESSLSEASESEDNDPKIPDEIEPYVKRLEAKGYMVKYSSPGYSNTRFDNDRDKNGVINSKLVTTARIIFDKDYDFKATPQGWEWKVLKNGQKALYGRPYTYNEKQGTEKESFNKWKEFYLSGLDTWINNLQKVGKDKPEDKDVNFN